MGNGQRRAGAEAAADVTSVRKKSLSRALVKKVTELSPPGKKKITERAQRRPRRGEHARRAGTGGGLPRTAAEAVPMSPMVVCLCVCVSRTKTVVLHSRSYKSRTIHKTSNKKKVINTTLCTTMPWWNYPKNTPVFRRGVKIPLCRHTTPLVEIRLR